MRVGVPKELKDNEYRVGAIPATVRDLVTAGHTVLVERSAGLGSAISDDQYRSAGATIVDDADAVWAEAELVLKVKEPVKEEFHRLRAGQVLFTYLHLAADPRGARAVLDSGVTAIAYETVRTHDGGLPLLAPMSEVAGRLAAQAGAQHLLKSAGGRGVLMGGVPGVAAANVVVIGGGVAGFNAAVIAAGMGAEVTILDVSVPRLRQLDAHFGGRVRTVASSAYAVESAVAEADLVIGAVLMPGAKAPTLVSNEQVAGMRAGSVLVDIAIDQGGCFQDSRPTTHTEPTYPVHGSTFYCVANMPGAVPRTSTFALANVTAPYARKLADLGWQDALRADPVLAGGLNAHAGELTNASVGEALGISTLPVEQVIAA